jgi:hypothetical protein
MPDALFKVLRIANSPYPDGALRFAESISAESDLHYNAPSEVIYGPPGWVRAITLFRVSRPKLFLSSHKDYLRGPATSREWRVQIDSLPVPRPPLFVCAIARISLSQALSALHLRKWLRGHCGNVVRFLAFPPCGFESSSPSLALGGIKNSE